MALLSRRGWLRAALALLAGGCGRNALRTPTPAAELNTFALRYAAPGERFYAIVCSAQSIPRRPAYAHTWVTVVRAVERPGQRPEVLDAHTISWLPATLVIRPLRFEVEPGVNLDVHQSLAFALANDMRPSMWGPYETQPSFYRRFLVQKEFLETSGVGYQCDDNVGEAARTGTGCNCIHGITDMDPTYGRDNFPLVWFGDPASEHLANRLHKGTTLINPEVEHDWVLGALGLCDYPIKRRRYGDRLLDFPRVPPGSRRRPLPPRPTGGGPPRATAPRRPDSRSG